MRVRFLDWTLDSDARELRRGGTAVRLSPKAFRLLELLLAERPRAVSKSDLRDRLWPETFVTEASLTTLVKELRTALEDRERSLPLIRTAFGHGYAFAGEATAESEEPRPIESVVVFPFANGSGDATREYICDGIAEELTNYLTRIRGLRVVPRSSAFRYRDRRHDRRAAARELRARALVAGRVDFRGDTIDVQVDLLDAHGERQIWGGRFRARGGDLLALQTQIAIDIARQLTLEVAGHGKRRVGTSSAVAYDLYLRGRHHWNRRSADSLPRAIESFAAAIAIDEQFADAHAALAEAYVALGSRDLLPGVDAFELARAAVLRALAIDDSIAAAHTASAAVAEIRDWNWRRAEKEHLRAIDVDPTYATAAQWYALYLARRGRHGEARGWIDRALALEPLSTIINTNAALIAYLARDFPHAAAQADRTIELDPHFDGGYLIAGLSRCMATDVTAGIAVLQDAGRLSANHPFTSANLAWALHRVGRAEEADGIAHSLQRPIEQALVSIGRGDRRQALLQLQAAATCRSPWLVYLNTDPRFEALRNEPAFADLVQAIEYGE